MNCDQIEELLSDLLDDELPDGARAGVEAHVAACERCTAAYHALVRTVRFVRSNANVTLEPGTPGGQYYAFTRAMMDEASTETPEEILINGAWGSPSQRSSP
jgi:anti-sigma factor RsiW